MYSSVCGILIVQTQCAITMADVYKYPFVWVWVHSVVIVSPSVGIKPKLVKNNVSMILFDRKGLSFMIGSCIKAVTTYPLQAMHINVSFIIDPV